jgi:hypothetical protein
MLDAFFEFVVELVIRLPGYLVLRCLRLFRRSKPGFGSDRVILTGCLFWVVVGAIIVLLFWLVR